MQGNGREIKYTDEWNSETFIQNELYDPKITEDDYGQLPLPFLRSEIKRRESSLSKDKKQKQANRPFTIALILSWLLGQTTTTTTSTTTMAPSTTTDPSSMTLSSRTRRPTKYKKKGNCKNPPKKHPEDSDTGKDSDSDKE